MKSSNLLWRRLAATTIDVALISLVAFLIATSVSSSRNPYTRYVAANLGPVSYFDGPLEKELGINTYMLKWSRQDWFQIRGNSVTQYRDILLTSPLFADIDLTHRFMFGLWLISLIVFAAFMEASLGGTIGKLCLGLRVRDPAITISYGFPSFKRALLRNFLKLAWYSFLGAGLLPILFTKGRVSFHDSACKTEVVMISEL